MKILISLVFFIVINNSWANFYGRPNLTLITPVKLSDMKIPQLQSVTYLEEKYQVISAPFERGDYLFFTNTKQSIPFGKIAKELQYTISEIGDWEDTFVNPMQTKKIYAALLSNTNNGPEFKKILNIIQKDLNEHTDLRYIGILFGRDWYWGSGKVAFVLRMSNQIIVIPMEFDNSVKFNDPRLDYVY